MGWLGCTRATISLSVFLGIGQNMCSIYFEPMSFDSQRLFIDQHWSQSEHFINKNDYLELGRCFLPGFFLKDVAFHLSLAPIGPYTSFIVTLFFFTSFCCQCLLEVACGYILLSHPVWESQSHNRGVQYIYNNRCVQLLVI